MIRKLFAAMLAMMILVVLLSAASWFRTKQKLGRYCQAVTTGSPVVAARQKALDEGFRFIEPSYDQGGRKKALVTASGVMGRLVCEIEHDGKRVTKASLLSND